MVDKKIFASRLIECRTNLGLLSKDVADVLNVSKSAVNLYEKGKGLPSAEKLVELADLLNVSIDYLLGRTENPNLNSK
ncbi:helix-turn-helix domain-containing protein [Brevibacillus laterosporus]|uniref:helix-turn-helix domain-containing protein n=1 Tax=Brevibacillus laterosporus TaxID=1465 RepID=UPI0018CD4BD3|nr:helix-turn-helix transcriptional regulator [Brevibacillus laterosporus]MBG9786905.1 hypothetical protein [Brevibacillus laterosporus]